MKFLIVEDDEVDRQAAVRFLEKLDIEVTCASTLEEATKLDFEQDFDVILLDSILPDSCSPQVSQYFAETARASVAILTGCPESFSRFVKDNQLIVIGKDDLSGRIEDVLDLVRKKIQGAN